ncbi:MAG TPA: hypothetical protein VL863_14635 [bacterium]|jgi:hypothetical protein|nr:hypothetical protein [bacterium]
MNSNPSVQRAIKRNAKIRNFLWAGVAGMVVSVLVVVIWKRHFHNYTPVEVALDLKAGFGARHAAVPAKEFLELRYGPQTDPANRRAAFIDLFNPGHIAGLALIVGNRSDKRTRDSVADTAQIIRDYRRTMSPDEKTALADYFNSAAGQAQVQASAANFQSQSAHYRAITAPVTYELMTTLAGLQNH